MTARRGPLRKEPSTFLRVPIDTVTLGIPRSTGAKPTSERSQPASYPRGPAFARSVPAPPPRAAAPPRHPAGGAARAALRRHLLGFAVRRGRRVQERAHLGAALAAVRRQQLRELLQIVVLRELAVLAVRGALGDADLRRRRPELSSKRPSFDDFRGVGVNERRPLDALLTPGRRSTLRSGRGTPVFTYGDQRGMP